MRLKKLVKIMALNFPNEKVCNNVAAEFQFQHGNLGILQFKSKPQTQRIFSAELFLTNLPLVKKRMLESLFNHKLFLKQLNKMTLFHCIGCNGTSVIFVDWVIL